MSDMKSTFRLRDRAGNLADVELDAAEYQAANQLGLSLTQYLSQKYGAQTDEAKYGSVINQMMLHAGMYLHSDSDTGLKAPSFAAIQSNRLQVNALVRDDGSGRNTPNGRLLFPEIIMRAIESELREDTSDFVGGWNSMIALTTTVTSPKFDQPVINVKEAEKPASAPVSQLSEPDAMVSITTSNITSKIVTRSIGLMISDEAQEAATLDLVNIVMSAQARGERIRMIERDIKSIAEGNSDRDTRGGLSTVQAKSYDSALTTAGTISHKAWVKYLRSDYQKRSINRIITSVDVALAIEGRSGKPTMSANFSAEGTNLPVDQSIDNLAAQSPRVLLVDEALLGANILLGLDSRYALRRVINVSASYSAIEQFLMRRATGFRIDYGEMTHRLYDDAFNKMALTVT